MEIIKNYLENMFRNLPHTQEIERLKNDLLSNMEEKYQELKNQGKLENEAIGIVISEFGNIDELLEEMNIQTEILQVQDTTYSALNLEEARTFIELKRKSAYFVGVGVSLILIGVSLMISMRELMQSENKLPLITLFLFIAPAVGLFIYSGSKLDRFKYIEDGHFELEAAVKVVLDKELPSFAEKQSISTIAGVCLCVLSPVAIFLASFFEQAVFGVSILLLMIATAVFLFITRGGVPEAYKMLLKTGEFTPERKKHNKVIGAVAGIVWPLAVSIFLLCGFLFNLWDICWVIFPITGILFGGFCAFYSIIKSS